MAARVMTRPAERVAIGIKRVSLLKQVDNYSFDGQGNKFAMLADRWDCKIPPELMIEDKGYSGTDFNRPSIKKAQDLIRAGAANAVAFPWVDRFAREVEGGLATIREFRELGADVLLGDLGWYSNEGHFRFQMNMFLAVAQYQRDDIADKSRWGVQAKLERGIAHYNGPYMWHMVSALEIGARALAEGLPVPTGKPQNFFERKLDEVETMHLIGDLALAGGRRGSLRGICRELTERGIKSPGGLDIWNPVSLRYIIHDEVYSTGIWYYGKRAYTEPKTRRLPNAVRNRVRTLEHFKPREQWGGSFVMPGGPIWTPDEHVAIMEAVKLNGKTSVGKPALPEGREALLKGILKCAAPMKEGEDRAGEPCGRPMGPVHSRKVKLDGTRSMWYHCIYRGRLYSEYFCNCRSIKGELLEQAVWQGAKQAICVDLDSLITAHYAQIVTKEDASEVDRLREQHKRKTAMRRDAMRKEIESRDAADKAEYAGLVTQYKAELALLEKRIQNSERDTEPERMDTAAVKERARKAFKTEDPAEMRAILLDWVQNVGYHDGWATITVAVQIGAVNCKLPQQPIYDKQLLLTTRVKVAVAA